LCTFTGFIITANLENFGNHAGIDIVSRCGASIASENGKIRAGDAEGGAAIVGVTNINLSVSVSMMCYRMIPYG
jgi:hypothetical protein